MGFLKLKRPNFLKSKEKKHKEKLLNDFKEGKILEVIIKPKKNNHGN